MPLVRLRGATNLYQDGAGYCAPHTVFWANQAVNGNTHRVPWLPADQGPNVANVGGGIANLTQGIQNLFDFPIQVGAAHTANGAQAFTEAIQHTWANNAANQVWVIVCSLGGGMLWHIMGLKWVPVESRAYIFDPDKGLYRYTNVLGGNPANDLLGLMADTDLQNHMLWNPVSVFPIT